MSLSLYKNLDMYNKNWLIEQYNLPPPPDTFNNYNNYNNYNSRPQVIKTEKKKLETKVEAKAEVKTKVKLDKLKKQIDFNKQTMSKLTQRGREISQDTAFTSPAKKKYLSEIKIMIDDTILKSKMLKDNYNKLNTQTFK
jgi:hypothetical protein